MADTDDRHGQVFIAPHLDGGFGAYWENEEPDKGDAPGMVRRSRVPWIFGGGPTM